MVIPTYNERDNISALVPEILKHCPDVQILVVDDGSPDGTSSAVLDMKKSGVPVHLLSREGKAGLGRAYVAGFEWALKKNFEVIVEMDADFSHRPEDLASLLRKASEADFLIGSRYCPGGGVKNWGLGRRLLSLGGSTYARWILGFPLRDWTGGFNLWNRRVLEKIGLRNIQSNGYAFQIELKYRALKLGFQGLEVPIVFDERREGQSKMSSDIVWEALLRVWSIRKNVGREVLR